MLLLPPPDMPMAVARALIAKLHADDHLTMRLWRGGWMRWHSSHWVEVESAEVRSWVYQELEHAYFEKGKAFEAWAPTRFKVANVLEAVGAVTHLSESVNPPAWLIDDAPTPAGELVACTNGLLHVGTRKLLPLTAAFFNVVSVPFAHSAEAREPVRWLAFLDQLWPGDPESVAALQEWFGYVLSGRTDLHKILLLIGPIRAGKGTIARVLVELIGHGNAAGPTLASLGTNFGLSPLLGRPLAIVSDARLAGTGVHQVVERLLSISGEDTLTVDRKYREPWTGKLPTRFMILSNELPRFGDASGAISSRFVVLTLRESFYGRENTQLTAELLEELPGILSWALDGLDRITRRGRLSTPAASDDAIAALQDLVSPTSAFVRERCTTDPDDEIWVNSLYDAWKAWCEDNGHKPGSVQGFGRDLRAVLPGLRVVRPELPDGTRYRAYKGIALISAHNAKDRGRSRTESSPDSHESGTPDKAPSATSATKPIVDTTSGPAYVGSAGPGRRRPRRVVRRSAPIMTADTLPIDRPLTDPERSLLAYLSVWVVVEQTGTTRQQAADALRDLADRGEVIIDGDAWQVNLKVAGRVLVHMSREDLALVALEEAAPEPRTRRPGCPPRAGSAYMSQFRFML